MRERLWVYDNVSLFELYNFLYKTCKYSGKVYFKNSLSELKISTYRTQMKKSQVISIRMNKSTTTCIAVNLMPCPMIPQQVLVMSYHGEVCYSKRFNINEYINNYVTLSIEISIY